MDNAKAAIQFRKNIETQMSDLEGLPDRFLAAFLDLLDADSSICIKELAMASRDAFNEFCFPFKNEKLNELHNSLLDKPEEAKRLKAIISTIGEDIDIVEIRKDFSLSQPANNSNNTVRKSKEQPLLNSLLQQSPHILSVMAKEICLLYKNNFSDLLRELEFKYPISAENFEIDHGNNNQIKFLYLEFIHFKAIADQYSPDERIKNDFIKSREKINLSYNWLAPVSYTVPSPPPVSLKDKLLQLCDLKGAGADQDIVDLIKERHQVRLQNSKSQLRERLTTEIQKLPTSIKSHPSALAAKLTESTSNNSKPIDNPINSNYMAKNQLETKSNLHINSQSNSGLGRLAFFVLNLVFSIVVAVASNLGAEGIAILAAFAGLVVWMLRFKNIGRSPFFALLAIIPIVNLFLLMQAVACPPGYHQHGNMDIIGKIILLLCTAFIVLMAILIFSALVTG